MYIDRLQQPWLAFETLLDITFLARSLTSWPTLTRSLCWGSFSSCRPETGHFHRQHMCRSIAPVRCKGTFSVSGPEHVRFGCAKLVSRCRVPGDGDWTSLTLGSSSRDLRIGDRATSDSILILLLFIDPTTRSLLSSFELLGTGRQTSQHRRNY
jgi:hypothetical protein